MIAESEEALQHNMQDLNDRLEEWEMKAKWQNIRVMRIGRKKDVCIVEVNGQEVEQVEVMKYLSVMISSNGSMDSEEEQRIRNDIKNDWGDWENSAGKERRAQKCEWSMLW